MLRTIASDSPLLRNWRFYGYLPNLDYITMELSMEVRSKKIGHILNADKISEKKGHLFQILYLIIFLCIDGFMKVPFR